MWNRGPLSSFNQSILIASKPTQSFWLLKAQQQTILGICQTQAQASSITAKVICSCASYILACSIGTNNRLCTFHISLSVLRWSTATSPSSIEHPFYPDHIPYSRLPIHQVPKSDFLNAFFNPPFNTSSLTEAFGFPLPLSWFSLHKLQVLLLLTEAPRAASIFSFFFDRYCPVYRGTMLIFCFDPCSRRMLNVI